MKDERLLEMRIFKAVIDAGGFTAAAHLLGVSQPFVSQGMRSLERRLGVQLLHRSTRMQRLTNEGNAFLHRASPSSIMSRRQKRKSAPANRAAICASVRPTRSAWISWCPPYPASCRDIQNCVCIFRCRIPISTSSKTNSMSPCGWDACRTRPCAAASCASCSGSSIRAFIDYFVDVFRDRPWQTGRPD